MTLESPTHRLLGIVLKCMLQRSRAEQADVEELLSLITSAQESSKGDAAGVGGVRCAVLLKFWYHLLLYSGPGSVSDIQWRFVRTGS